MGRKRIKTWKYFHLCITGLILLSFLGCATLKEIENGREARESIIRSQKLLVQGDYEGSLKENRKALSLSNNNPPGDEALFNMGLIHAHSEYPRKDYKNSLNFLRRLIKDYPQSPLVEQAKIWIGILQENEKLSKGNEELNKTIRELNKAIQKSQQVDIEIEEKKKGL